MLPAAISPPLLSNSKTWTNGNDGLWRWMPSIAVDQSGNTVIGYSTSSTTIFPAIRYAGRLAADPPSNLGARRSRHVRRQSAVQTSGGRWGDYTRTDVDPSDGMTFWHVNEYAQSGALAHAHRQVQFRRRRPNAQRRTPTATPACLQLVGWSRHAECRNPHRLASFSRLTASFTPWAAACPTQQAASSLTRLNTIRSPTAGPRSRPPTLTTR